MAGKRKKKKGLIVLIVVLVILVAAIWAGKTFVYDKAKEKVTLAVAEKMIEEQVQNDSTGQLQNAQDIYNSMSEEDKQTVNDMIESKVSATDHFRCQQICKRSGQRRFETVRQREVYRERDPADERPL